MLRSNLTLNQWKNLPNRPPSPCSWPFSTGFMMVAHSAGVKTMATSTDSAIADTMVIEN